MNINYRLLNADEWDRLREIYPEDMPLPTPLTASVAVAEKEGKIVAALFMQLALHMEPLIRKDGEADYRVMAEQLTSLLPSGVQYFSQVPDERMGHIAEELGMRKSESQLYVGGA